MSILEEIDRSIILQEACYGAIMALTFVTGIQLGLMNMDAGSLIMAILAMDFVWGVIDLVIMYDIDIINENGSRQTLRTIYEQGRPGSMRKDAEGLLEGTAFNILSEEDREKAVDILMNGRFGTMKECRRNYRGYLVNAVAAFLVNFGSAFPAVICIASIDDLYQACFCAALTTSVYLFFIGYFFSTSRRRAVRILWGSAFLGITLLMTLFAAYFGG